MSSIYSTLFVDVHATSDVLEYDFPDGFVYVVRDISGFCSNALGAATFQAYDDANATFWYSSLTVGEAGIWDEWQGRQVFYGGGKLFLTGAAISIPVPSFDWRVSGYRLSP